MTPVLAWGLVFLQVRHDMKYGQDEVSDNTALHSSAFASKSLSSVDWQYSNIEWEALGILHRLEKFHHYCFGKEVCIITDQKPLVVMDSKNFVTQSQWLQCNMLHIHHYSMHIHYNPGLDLYIVHLLSNYNYTENMDQEIAGMSISIHTINTMVDVSVCTSTENIRAAISGIA